MEEEEPKLKVDRNGPHVEDKVPLTQLPVGVNKDNAAKTRIRHWEHVVDTGDEGVAPMEWVSVVPTQMSEVNLGAPDSSGFVMTPRTVGELPSVIVSEPELKTTRGI